MSIILLQNVSLSLGVTEHSLWLMRRHVKVTGGTTASGGKIKNALPPGIATHPPFILIVNLKKTVFKVF